MAGLVFNWFPRPERYSGRNATGTDMDELAEGTLVGDRYRVVRLLGTGGFGSVYEKRFPNAGAMRDALAAVDPSTIPVASDLTERISLHEGLEPSDALVAAPRVKVGGPRAPLSPGPLLTPDGSRETAPGLPNAALVSGPAPPSLREETDTSLALGSSSTRLQRAWPLLLFLAGLLLGAVALGLVGDWSSNTTSGEDTGSSAVVAAPDAGKTVAPTVQTKDASEAPAHLADVTVLAQEDAASAKPADIPTGAGRTNQKNRKGRGDKSVLGTTTGQRGGVKKDQPPKDKPPKDKPPKDEPKRLKVVD